MDWFTSVIAITLVAFGYYIVQWLLWLPKVGRIHDKYVLITGCDSGFGNMLTKRLDIIGCQVFASCLTDEGAEHLNSSTSDNVRTLVMDVADPESVRNATAKVRHWLPEGTGLWAIVNNAGILGRLGAVDWLTLDDYKAVADVNMFGLINVTNNLLPLVKKARGRVVNMCSFTGRLSLPLGTPYSVSKYGVEAFSDGLRFNMRAFGVSVHIIEPGFHNTNVGSSSMIQTAINKSWAAADEQVKQQYDQKYIEKVGEVLSHKDGFQLSDPDNVVKAYIHAIFGMFPRSRYVVGLDANLLGVPLSLLPAPVTDLCLSLVYPKPQSH